MDAFSRDDLTLRTLLAKATEARGEAWIQQLPSAIAACVERWSLILEPPFVDLSYNYAAPATRADGSHAVLKIGDPSDREFRTEAFALEIFDGRGVCRLLELDLETGAMLLERAEPGTPLFDVDDEEPATEAAVGVMQRLWRPVPDDHSFPTVAYWASGIQRLLRDRCGGGTGPLPAPLVERAEAHFADLLSSTGEQVLLHGDLHHWNILAAQREPWLAIDPKGVVGEREYEVGAILRNPAPQLLQQPDPAHILARRLDQLSEMLDFNRERLRDWGIAQAVLSAVWTFDDHPSGWDFALRCAEILSRL